QSRLRGEEIVAVRVRIALAHAIADGEEVARGIEEKAELHGLEVLAREPGEGEQATDERAAGIGRALEALGERVVRGTALRLGERRGGLPHEPESVLHAAQRARDEQRALGQLPAGLREGEKVTGEVSAVDGRDVRRLERTQRAGLVPVVVMPMKPLHFRQGFERRLEALDGVEEADPPEVTGGDRGEKIEADV